MRGEVVGVGVVLLRLILQPRGEWILTVLHWSSAPRGIENRHCQSVMVVRVLYVSQWPENGCCESVMVVVVEVVEVVAGLDAKMIQLPQGGNSAVAYWPVAPRGLHDGCWHSVTVEVAVEVGEEVGVEVQVVRNISMTQPQSASGPTNDSWQDLPSSQGKWVAPYTPTRRCRSCLTPPRHTSCPSRQTRPPLRAAPSPWKTVP
jgi:hypothetical protein